MTAHPPGLGSSPAPSGAGNSNPFLGLLQGLPKGVK